MTDIDFTIIVKTPQEIAAENKHGWDNISAPMCCFNNCFKREEALKPSHWKNIYPEYYWIMRRKRKVQTKIKQHDYHDDDELKGLFRSLAYIEEYIKGIQRPINRRPLSTIPLTLSATAAASG